MLLWRNDLTEPFWNMAAEEFLLMKAEQPCVMLWRNAPAVIIGKNQDARAEVDFSFAERHGIKIVRRLTGGGAVFHDTGNINYTFVVPDGNELDFSVFTKPVIDALAELGVRITTSGRNDLVTVPDAKKCSGTARYIYNRKTSDRNIRKILLHHGTLLFSADLASLSGVLTPDRAKLTSKGIQSVKSRVVNLKELLPPAYDGMTAEDFKHYLEDYFIRNGAIPHEFTPEDRVTIERLAAEKYETDVWLFGRFGNGKQTQSRRFDFGTVTVSLQKTENRIEKIVFSGDFFGDADISELERLLTDIPLDTEILENVLGTVNISRYMTGAAASEITELILGAAAASG